MDNQLQHHGILGMKWGVRKTPENSGGGFKKRKKKFDNNYQNNNKNRRKEDYKFDPKKREEQIKRERQTPHPSTLTMKELNLKSDRMLAEKKYNDLVSKKSVVSRGKKMIGRALEKNGERLLNDLMSYGEGKALESILTKQGATKEEIERAMRMNRSKNNKNKKR